MANALVIVESPAKADKIAGYLGDGYTVEASVGHIRDLPRKAAEVPKAYKGEKWANLGIDVDNDFKPLYIVSPDERNKKQVKKLKDLMKKADTLYLATDKDREGEAIAWHLIEVLSPPPNVEVKRMVFTEITPKAIQEALDSPRELDRRLVDAQEARRLLDRLYGYEVSPVLWKKVAPRLSAGRVQSVATRIVVERERERMAFVAASYWDLTADFAIQRDAEAGEPSSFTAKLVELDGKKIAAGRDFGQDGKLKTDDIAVVDEATATALVADLDGQASTVKSRESRPYKRRPAAPFITSTFQQEAGRKLKMSSTMAMRAAQSLYEKGHITYMRTDSTTLSDTAVAAARSVITEKFGNDFLPGEPRVYATKDANAQEAHEAIRPAGDTFAHPDDLEAELVKSEHAVYDLIWKRTVASQMTDATGETVNVRVGVRSRSDRETTFSASGTVIQHQGFRKVYIEDTPADAKTEEAAELALPNVSEGNGLDASNIASEGHETQPPARYTEASLVKKLEELKVGRPSTYASIMETIQNRGYVWKKGSALVPAFTAFSVVTLLENHFPDLVDYAFTAQMEVDLDNIAKGSQEAVPWLSRFYFGETDDAPGLKEKVSERLGEIDARGVNSIPIGLDANGQTVVARVGQYGPYVERSTTEVDEEGKAVYQRASIPDDIAPDELTIEKAIQYIEAPDDDRQLGEHPETGLPVFVKNGRFGPYVQLGEIDDAEDGKPKRSSLFKTMTPETVTLDEALQLLSLPRVVGNHPADQRPITVQNGKFGPYLSYHSVENEEAGKKADSRTLESEEMLLTVTLDECVKILAEPKRRRGQAAPKGPLRELGPDPMSGEHMVIKDGRFGPYVTAGGVNASLRKGDTVEQLSVERAAELLELRRIKMAEQGKLPAKKKAKKATKKKTAKKATAKKATAKKATKKTAAKKATDDTAD